MEFGWRRLAAAVVAMTLSACAASGPRRADAPPATHDAGAPRALDSDDQARYLRKMGKAAEFIRDANPLIQQASEAAQEPPKDLKKLREVLDAAENAEYYLASARVTYRAILKEFGPQEAAQQRLLVVDECTQTLIQYIRQLKRGL